MAVFAMMSLLTELGILTDRFFYKYPAPHGACGAKLPEAQLKNDVEAAWNLAHFKDFKVSLLARSVRKYQKQRDVLALLPPLPAR